MNGVDGTTLNVGTISGGTKFNIIPAEATAEVNIRAWTVRARWTSCEIARRLGSSGVRAAPQTAVSL